MIALGVFALVIVLGEWGQAQAQDPKAPYASMAPLDQYLMVDRDAEIAMARSAAPEAISRDADVLVLGRHGYETAVKGKNGFVCVVERDRTKTTFDKSELPVPEPGSMCYKLSKQQNFGSKYGNADPHLMFWCPQKDHRNWGGDFPGSPVDVHQYSPQPITEFVISASKWSDGTAAHTNVH
jgi:hypothetical protein